MVDLALPDVRFRRSYLQASDEFGDAHRDGDGLWTDEPDGGYPGFSFTRADLESVTGFQRFVDHRLASALVDAPRRGGWVRCTFLWIVEGDTYLGSLAIRHSLNDYLLQQGGHIGYSVRLSARRRGIATAALAQAIPYAAQLGIDHLLVTCVEDNAGSRHIIEACGGVYEDSRVGARRYWIATH